MPSILPTIDFGLFLEGSVEGRRVTIAEIDKALQTVGAFYLRNYGIERAKIDTLFKWVG